MHELAVCQALLNQVEALARRYEAQSVRGITVRVGALSGVVPELLAQAFAIARAGTLAGDAELVIETAPVRVRCAACGAETEAGVNRLVCGRCGNEHTRLVSGDELLLVSMELTA